MGKINASSLSKQIPRVQRYTKENVANAIKQWFTKNGLIDGSKYVETRQGLRVHFTGISEWHFAKDVVDSEYQHIALNAVCYLPEVFEQGIYLGEQPLNKDRSHKRAKFVKFHSWKKKVKIGNYEITIKAKAGEYENGKIVLLPKLTSYTFYIIRVKKRVAVPNDSHTDKSAERRLKPQITAIKPATATPDYDSVYLDDVQEDLATFEILDIKEIKTKTPLDRWLDSKFGR